MSGVVLVVLAMVASGAATLFWQRWRRAARAEHIRHFVFPIGLFDELQKRHPQLSRRDCQLVANALRQFFLAYLHGGGRYVSMPSQVVDDLWHALILHTRTYQAFCGKAFGRFLHHSPAVTLGSQRRANEGLRRVWWHACAEENIDPRRPIRLPLLFAIDRKLAIVGGFTYAANCAPLQARADAAGAAVVHCGGDFSSTSIDGTTDGLGDGDGTGGGDGGGDSGSSCGGGGCGGD